MSSSSTQNFYDVLQISRTADVSEIKKAYRKLALKYHPDKNKDSPTASDKFKDVQHAYETLSDPIRKRTYDASIAPKFTPPKQPSMYQRQSWQKPYYPNSAYMSSGPGYNTSSTSGYANDFGFDFNSFFQNGFGDPHDPFFTKFTSPFSDSTWKPTGYPRSSSQRWNSGNDRPVPDYGADTSSHYRHSRTSGKRPPDPQPAPQPHTSRPPPPPFEPKQEKAPKFTSTKANGGSSSSYSYVAEPGHRNRENFQQPPLSPHNTDDGDLVSDEYSDMDSNSSYMSEEPVVIDSSDDDDDDVEETAPFENEPSEGPEVTHTQAHTAEAPNPESVIDLTLEEDEVVLDTPTTAVPTPESPQSPGKTSSQSVPSTETQQPFSPADVEQEPTSIKREKRSAKTREYCPEPSPRAKRNKVDESDTPSRNNGQREEDLSQTNDESEESFTSSRRTRSAEANEPRRQHKSNNGKFKTPSREHSAKPQRTSSNTAQRVEFFDAKNVLELVPPKAPTAPAMPASREQLISYGNNMIVYLKKWERYSETLNVYRSTRQTGDEALGSKLLEYSESSFRYVQALEQDMAVNSRWHEALAKHVQAVQEYANIKQFDENGGSL